MTSWKVDCLLKQSTILLQSRVFGMGLASEGSEIQRFLYGSTCGSDIASVRDARSLSPCEFLVSYVFAVVIEQEGSRFSSLLARKHERMLLLTCFSRQRTRTAQFFAML